MPTSIIDIDVNADTFKDFLGLFQKYQEALKEVPEGWQDVSKATGAAGVTMNDLAAAMLTQHELLQESLDDYKEVGKAAAIVDRTLWGIDKRFESIQKRAQKVTKEFALWGTAIGGLGLGLGILGIDRLAASASQLSRGARGLGVDPAAQQAFSVNYHRYVDPDAMLSNVAGMQGDMSKWGSLMAAGIGTGEIQGDDPETLSQRIIQRAKELWDQAGPNNHTAQFMQAHGLDQLLPGGLQDWRRIGGASQADLDQAAQDERKDKKAFNLPPDVLKAWTDFDNQMHRAGITMEDTIIKKLGPLAEPLTQLSKSISDAISILLDDKDLKGWISEAGEGIKEFATYLASPDFKTDLQTAKDDFHKFTTAMGDLIDWVEKKIGDITNTGQSVPGQPGLVVTPLGPVGVLPPPQPHESWWQRMFGNIGYVPWNMPSQTNYDNQGNAIPSPTPGAGEGIGAWVHHQLGALGFEQHGIDAHGRKVGEPGYDPTSDPGSDAYKTALQGNAKESWDFWKSKGYTDAAAASEVANERGESGFDPNIRGDNGTAGGIEQWHKDRRDAILKATGIDVWHASHADQLKAAWLERQGIDLESTRVQGFIQNATTTNQAVTGLVTGVERSKNQASDIQTRVGYANEALRRFGGTPAAAPSAPADTLANAINKLRRAPVAPAKVALTVHDQTGGNAVVAAAQVAH